VCAEVKWINSKSYRITCRNRCSGYLLIKYLYHRGWVFVNREGKRLHSYRGFPSFTVLKVNKQDFPITAYYTDTPENMVSYLLSSLGFLLLLISL